MKLFHWLVTVPLTVLLVDFALWNGGTTTLDFWPLPVSLQTRVFVVVLVPLFAGFVIGELTAWMHHGRNWRRAARRDAQRIEALERELATKVPSKEPSKEIARN